MGVPLSGRASELERVDETIAGLPGGPRVLAIEGEAGIGKTTLWREGTARAARRGWRVLECRPAEAETAFSFAGLGDLLGSVDGRAIDSLPEPQRHALEVALLRERPDGSAPAPRAIGAATLSVLRALSEDTPVVLAVDDVQWLDVPTAEALEFALRRLDGSPVALLATLRTTGVPRPSLLDVVEVAGTPRLRLGPLDRDALHGMLRQRLGDVLTPTLLGRIERASRGNPFRALEVARAWLEGGVPESGDESLPVPDDVRELINVRLRRLPVSTREELLKASALTDPALPLIDPEPLGPAVEAEIVSIRPDDRVEFSHPLFRDAVYSAASADRRRDLHRELADSVGDLEERARHLALASDEPDERIAAVLEEASELAHRRGATIAAAELAERAAELTPAGSEAADERRLRAAGHLLRGGDRERAQVLAETVIAGSGSALGPRALLLLAEAQGLTRPEAAIGYLDRAVELAGEDVALATELEIALALATGAVTDAARVERHAERAVELAVRSGDDALVSQALAMRGLIKITFGRGLDEPELERALELEDLGRDVPFQVRPSLNAAQAYEFAGRWDIARSLLEPLRELLVARGAEGDLPLVLIHLAVTAEHLGDLAAAERDADEALRVATLTDQELFRAFAFTVRTQIRAIRGDADGARADAAAALELSERIGWPWGMVQTLCWKGFLELSEGNPTEAAATLAPAIAATEEVGIYEYPMACGIPDAVEALVAAGDAETAERITAALADWGHRFDRPWCLATSGRCRALLEAAGGDLDAAQAAAERALVEHERLPMPFERGRTLLVYGQLQRRRGERRAGRETLERAAAIFEEVGAPLWGEKARAEGRRIGVRRAPTDLTENEEQVARLAAGGLTNREIAAKLFVSPRTVEANLSRAYKKLDIHSRAELGAKMALRDAPPA